MNTFRNATSTCMATLMSRLLLLLDLSGNERGRDTDLAVVARLAA